MLGRGHVRREVDWQRGSGAHARAGAVRNAGGAAGARVPVVVRITGTIMRRGGGCAAYRAGGQRRRHDGERLEEERDDEESGDETVGHERMIR